MRFRKEALVIKVLVLRNHRNKALLQIPELEKNHVFYFSSVESSPEIVVYTNSSRIIAHSHF